MKFAVCSRSSTASRTPPSEILGTLAVAALPTGFARRSSILLVSLAFQSPGVELVEDDTDQLALCIAEGCDDVFHAVVDVKAGRQGRDKGGGDIEQLAVGRAPGHRRPVEDYKIVAAGLTRPPDRLVSS